MFNYRYWFILFPFLLMACQKPASPSELQQGKQSPPVAQQQSIVAAIERQGAQVIQQGARLQIILPTDEFFRMPSTQLRSYQVDTMRLIAQYLKDYAAQFEHPPKIRVYGYTDKVYTREQQSEMSQRYAEVIASFLWNQGFSHKQLQIEGLSSTDPIASQKTTQGSSYNRRVVIQVN